MPDHLRGLWLCEGVRCRALRPRRLADADHRRLLGGPAQQYLQAGGRREMIVALLGATGKAAARLIAELRRRGHEVTGISRNLPEADPGIPFVAADANDAAALTEAIRGHDALIVAARFVSI